MFPDDVITCTIEVSRKHVLTYKTVPLVDYMNYLDPMSGVINMTGAAFLYDNITVTIDNYPCQISSLSEQAVRCHYDTKGATLVSNTPTLNVSTSRGNFRITALAGLIGEYTHSTTKKFN